MIDDVVILAGNELRLGPNTSHVSGQIVVNAPGGLATVSQLFRTVPDLTPQFVADQIRVTKLFYPGPQFFDVFTNSIEDPVGNTVALGTITSPIGTSLPLLPYPTPAAVTPGTTRVVVTRTGSPVTLDAGSFGDVRIAAGGALVLSGGEYHFNSLIVGPRAILSFSGTTTLNIADRLRLGARAVLGPSDPEANPRCVTVNVASASRIRVGRIADVGAILNAPLAMLKLGKLGSFRGRFTAARIVVGRTAVLQIPPPLQEACP